MATGKETAKFSVKLDDQVSGPADEAADALESLRRRISEGTERLKDMAGTMRRLSGSTQEVKKAKEELRAKLASERDAISAAQLAMLKAGGSYDQLTAKSKKLSSETKDVVAKSRDMGAALNSVGGPVAGLRSKLSSLSEMFSQAGGASGIAVLGIAAIVAACVALTAAAGAALISFGKFVLESANAARTANLFREAATGSAQNAYNLGTQVDALAKKVPTAKAALNDLAISMAKNGIGGQTLVDTLNAVGQASAALGDDAGAKLRELVERGRLSQRFAVNPLELQGSGLQFDDIAKSLAKSMHVGVASARMALLQGRVKLADGAKALREAVESKFGDINLRRMLDLNVLSEKFKETLAGLTKDVKLEPLLAGLKKLSELFGEGTVTGATVKQLVTLLGNGMVKALTTLLPLAEYFFKGAVVGALDLLIGIFKLKNSLSGMLGGDALKGISLLSLAFDAGKFAVMAFAAAAVLVGGVLAAMVASVGAVVGAIFAIQKAGESLGKYLREVDWAATGSSIVDGLIQGLSSSADRLLETVKGLADRVKRAFTGKLEIHSPSAVFAEYGENTVEGYTQGVERRTRDADAAIARMGGGRPSAAAGGGGGRGITLQVANTFNIGLPPGMEPGKGAQLVDEMKPALRVAMAELVEEVLVELGIPRTITTGPEVA